MKRLKPKYIALGIVLIVFFFVPVMDMEYLVVVEKQVSEEYTTLEPYTVQERVTEQYGSYYNIAEDKKSWAPTLPTPLLRTVTKDVTKYREVTKTRLVTRPVAETRTKRVSILRYLLR